MSDPTLEPFKKSVRSLKRLARQHSRGIELFINLTHACPLRCTYCYVDYEKPSHWTIEKLEYLIDQMVVKQRLVKLITFFGGEPGLKVDMIEHTLDYAFARESGTTHFGIITSMSANPDRIIALAKKYPRFEIVVSMDAEAESDRKTIKGRSFIPIVSQSDNPRKLTYKRLQEVSASSMINKVIEGDEDLTTNLKWLQGVYDTYGIMFGLNLVKIPKPVNHEALKAGFLQHLHWCLTSDFMPRFTKNHLHHWVKMQIGIREPGCGINSEYFMDGSGETTPCSITHSHPAQQGADEKFFMITRPDGTISDQVEAVVELEGQYFNNPTCRGCEVRGLCTGGCLAARHQEHGRFDIPNQTYCDAMKAMGAAFEAFVAEVGEDTFYRFFAVKCPEIADMIGFCTDKNVFNSTLRQFAQPKVAFK